MRSSPPSLPGWVRPDEREPEEPDHRDLLLRLVIIAAVIAAVVVASWFIAGG